jgi:hypothetical protein
VDPATRFLVQDMPGAPPRLIQTVRQALLAFAEFDGATVHILVVVFLATAAMWGATALLVGTLVRGFWAIVIALALTAFVLPVPILLAVLGASGLYALCTGMTLEGGQNGGRTATRGVIVVGLPGMGQRAPTGRSRMRKRPQPPTPDDPIAEAEKG